MNGKAVKKAKTLLGEKGPADGYDRTMGHHPVCTCRPCRKKKAKHEICDTCERELVLLGERS